MQRIKLEEPTFAWSGKLTLMMIIEYIMVRVVPDIRPAGYPEFFISFIWPDIRFHLPDIRLAGYWISGISGSSIDEIVDILSNVNYIVLILKIEKF